jgi:hypothetical protein
MFGQALGIESVKEVGAQIPVTQPGLIQEVIHHDKDGVSDGDQGSLLPAARSEAPILGREIGVFVVAGGPPTLRDQLQNVLAVNVSVVVEVGDLAGPLVDGLIQIREADDTVGIDVRGLRADVGRNLALVDPNVTIDVWVFVVHSGVHNGHHTVRTALPDVPRLRSVDIRVNDSRHAVNRLAKVV